MSDSRETRTSAPPEKRPRPSIPPATLDGALTMPATKASDSGEAWQERLRDFHLTGEGANEGKARLAEPLWPAVCHAMRAAGSLRSAFPLHYQPTGEPSFQPLHAVLDEALQAASKSGDDLVELSGWASALVEEAARWLAEEGNRSYPPAEVLSQALKRLLKRLELPEDEAEALADQGRRLPTLIRNPGRVLPFTPAAAPFLYARVLAAGRSQQRSKFLGRIHELAGRLEGILGGAGGAGEDTSSLSDSLGEEGDRFLDASAMASSMKRTAGHHPLDDERRRRIEKNLDILQRFRERASTRPLLTIVHSEEAPVGLDLEETAWLQVPDPFAAALELCEDAMQEMTVALRAVRTAELEVAGAYVPAVHDRATARFTWEAAAVHEVEAAPAFLVFEPADRLAEQSLTAMGRLLRSGLPLQVLITREINLTGARREGRADAEPPPDFGYLAIAHREVFVVEAPLVEAEQLVQDLQRAGRVLRPTVAVVAVPPARIPPEEALWRAAAAHFARVTPSFSYDPDAGDAWAQRFSLQGNPQAERMWPGFELTLQRRSSEPATDAALSPAHAAALDPNHRDSFWVIPTDAWGDDQVELGEYLAKYDKLPPPEIPFIWVVTEGGVLARAVLTRDLANACRELKRAWRIYQELAGVHNQYVESAVAETRQQVEEQVETQKAAWMAEARHAGAAEAVYRLVTRLADPRGLSAGRLAPLSSPEALSSLAPHPNETAEVAEAPPEPPAAVRAPAGPYIDSALCTTCDECTNRNSRMFKYNDDKQAYIADVSAGTYAELVKAAAACPAKCIHPGPKPS